MHASREGDMEECTLWRSFDELGSQVNFIFLRPRDYIKATTAQMFDDCLQAVTVLSSVCRKPLQPST
jgi:hypothetical protein